MPDINVIYTRSTVNDNPEIIGDIIKTFLKQPRFVNWEANARKEAELSAERYYWYGWKRIKFEDLVNISKELFMEVTGFDLPIVPIYLTNNLTFTEEGSLATLTFPNIISIRKEELEKYLKECTGKDSDKILIICTIIHELVHAIFSFVHYDMILSKFPDKYDITNFGVMKGSLNVPDYSTRHVEPVRTGAVLEEMASCYYSFKVWKKFMDSNKYTTQALLEAQIPTEHRIANLLKDICRAVNAYRKYVMGPDYVEITEDQFAQLVISAKVDNQRFQELRNMVDALFRGDLTQKIKWVDVSDNSQWFNKYDGSLFDYLMTIKYPEEKEGELKSQLSGLSKNLEEIYFYIDRLNLQNKPVA